ncbi:TetR/AcrR family transcriptional regulator [Isoptericola sp. b441]|uniref:TetR/AcrR family transcriptional regulator n=1 Tax=Actinotalea lenta TaxID=3064654 RepID=A0ABT9DF89_9CELL|nr:MULTISPECIES: TetR/AcrR family transcriptional regulator [unclassified Isoptericola]MDO8108297.1 TetR/AcrR family transcriptional regulator [Isoptericola sp. b441]MDO8122691.1 TetR/AcrR family transcriptional regulator [Isoptericola sp. b490]
MAPRPPRMSADDRRAQVLAIAEQMFARDGYHHVSMDDIADRAEVSKPVLYRHFPSKLDLYLAVVDRRGQALAAAVDAELARASTADGPPGHDIARAIVAAFVGFVEQAGETSSLLFESDVTRDHEVRERVEAASREAADAVCRGLRDLTGLAQPEADLLAEVLVGMAQVTATSRHRPSTVDSDTAVDLVGRLAWSGVQGLIPGRRDAEPTSSS